MQEGVARFFKKTTETPFQRPITAPISIQTAASKRAKSSLETSSIVGEKKTPRGSP